jgi:hypothetical protein
MKLFLRILITASSILMGFQTKAQSTFSIAVENIDDTTYFYNENIIANLILKYNGGPNYTGLLRLGRQTLNGGNPISDTLPLFEQQLQQITTGQIIPFTVSIPVDPSFFLEGGGHTVIVWPVIEVFPVGATIDSIGFDIEVMGWASQTEWAVEKQARVFPVPATDFIMVEKPLGQARISVIDIRGRVVSSFQTSEMQIRIPLGELHPGYYFIKYSDGVKLDEIHSFIKR